MGPDGARPRELLLHLFLWDLQSPEDDPGPCLFLEDPSRGFSHAEQLRDLSQRHAALHGCPWHPVLNLVALQPAGPPSPLAFRGEGWRTQRSEAPHGSPWRTSVRSDMGLYVLKGVDRIGCHWRQMMPWCLVISADAITRTFQNSGCGAPKSDFPYP